MQRFVCYTLLSALLTFLATPWISAAVGDDKPVTTAAVTVSVTLIDGSKVRHAFADASTDEQHLVVRFESPGILLRRQVPWDRIVVATLDEQTYSAAELLAELQKRPLNHGGIALAGGSEETSEPRNSPYPNVATISRNRSVASIHGFRSDDRIQSLNVSAEVVNWDRDVAVDGLRVLVQPLNASGEMVPIDGVVDVSLFGQASLRAGGIRDFRRVDGFPEIGTWVQRVREEDFSDHGATYQFEFRRTNPEFNHRLSSIGLTHARLSVAGEGVFEASDAMTPIRPFSVYRDWHQQSTGHRFLPAEHLDSSN